MSGPNKKNRKKPLADANADSTKSDAPGRKAKNAPSTAPDTPAARDGESHPSVSNNGGNSSAALPGASGHCGPGHNGYHTDYFIEIQGSLKPNGGHLLIINNQVRIKVQWLQFILLVILASRARAKARLPTPIDIRGGDYLQPSRIAEIIESLKSGAVRCGRQEALRSGIDTGEKAIYDAKWDLRLKIKFKHKQPSLIDAIEGAGYRISTPAARIKITLVDPVDDEVYDWAE